MLLNVFCSLGQNICGPLNYNHCIPPKLWHCEMQLILNGYPGPAPLSYNNSVRTKVNALNLISVLVISNGVVMQVKGGGNMEEGSGSEKRLVVSGGLGRKQN